MSFHLRPPSIDKGVSAFLWAFGFFLYLWLGMIAVGVDAIVSFILSAVAGGAIFLSSGSTARAGRLGPDRAETDAAMIAGERVQQQALELLADRLAQPERSGRLHVLQAVHARAVLEDERQRAGWRLGGIHVPNIGPGARRANPSRE